MVIWAQSVPLKFRIRESILLLDLEIKPWVEPGQMWTAEATDGSEACIFVGVDFYVDSSTGAHDRSGQDQRRIHGETVEGPMSVCGSV